jgi:hypothetical protein
LEVCVPVIYGGIVTIVASIFCVIAWKLGWSKAPRNVSFIRFITTSYELETSDDVDDHLTLYAFFNHTYGPQERSLNPFHRRYKRSSNIEIPLIKKSDLDLDIDPIAPSPVSRITAYDFPNYYSPYNVRGTSVDMTDYFFHFLAENDREEEIDYRRQVTFDENMEEENMDESLHQNDLEKQPDFIAVDEEEKDPKEIERAGICSPKSQYEDDPKLYVRIDSDYHDEIVDWWNDVKHMFEHSKVV